MNWFHKRFVPFKQKETIITVCSLKNVVKPLVLLCFRSKRLKKHWLYGVFAQKYWKSIGFIVCSRRKVEKALVLLCCRSKVLKKQWFYCVFAPECWKNIGFTVFSLQNVEKAMVLLCFRLELLTLGVFYCVFAQKQLIKQIQNYVFVNMHSPNHLFYRCKLLAMFLSHCKCSKPWCLRRFEKQPLRSWAGRPRCCFTLCVCVSV